VLEHADADSAFAAEVLALPAEATLAEQMAVVDPDALHAARQGLRLFIADRLAPRLMALYGHLDAAGDYSPDAASAGRRALRNACLAYLALPDTDSARALAWQQFMGAGNMTDQFAALTALAQSEGPERQLALEQFHDRWQGEALVLDKWLAVQAASTRPATRQEVEALVGHPAFDLRNPNKVYALLRTFGTNHVRFHARDGGGYHLLAGQIVRLDPVNPQVAARLARSFDRWRRFDDARQRHARAALESIRDAEGLSRDVFEVVSRALE